jgi:hypothetical protein
MKYKYVTLVVVSVIGLALPACGSDTADVPSLGATPTPVVAEEALDNEARMMALTQCLREQGIDIRDPVLDSEGNVGKPEFIEGYDKEAFGTAWEACAEHLEGFTFGKERTDVSEQVDQGVAIATCLRDKGYDVDDPTAETLDQWLGDFKERINWKDPEAVADYEECSGAVGLGGGGK